MSTDTSLSTQSSESSHPRAGAPVWLELTTDDVAAAQDFYHGLFGWSFSQPHPELGDYIDIEADGSSLGGLMSSAEMECPEGGEIPNSWDVYLAVSNMDATVAQAQSAGALLLTGPHDAADSGRFAMLMDPAGAPIGIWQAAGFSGPRVTGAPGTPVWFEAMSMDFDAALAFYRDVLSWDIAWMGPEGGSDEFRYVTHGRADAASAGLCDAAKFFPGDTSSFWRVYFAVENADAAVKRVEELGGRLISETVSDSPFGRFATVADPTGATFLINQEPEAS